MEHKLIIGGEQYLPFARSRIKALQATGLEYASQRFEVDGASVGVRITPGHEYISLSGGGGANYEFMTPGGQGAGATYAGFFSRFAYAVNVSLSGGAFRATPTGSTAEAPSPTGKQWPYSNLPQDARLYAPHKNFWQIQHVVEHAYYPSILNNANVRKLDPTKTLTNSWCASSQLVNLRREALYERQQFSNFQTFTAHRPPRIYDVVYDIAPALFDKSKAFPEKQTGLVPDADWYKSASVRVVTHPTFGTRTFIILNDISQNFHAYPIVDPDFSLTTGSPYLSQLIKTNVQAQFKKTAAAIFPVWARYKTPNIGDGSARSWLLNGGGGGRQYLRKFPQYKWVFNSTGTKTACVAYEDLPAPIIPANNFNPPASGITFQTSHSEDSDGLPFVASFESLPGLVEMDVAITLTGLNPEDFTFGLSSAQVIQPSLSNKFILAVDYSWGKKPGGAANGTNLDDLMVMTLEHYPSTGDSNVTDVEYQSGYVDEQTFVSVRNLTQNTVVKQFTQSRDNLVQKYWMKFLAYDLRILAFLTEGVYRKRTVLAGDNNVMISSSKTVQASVYGVDETPLRMGNSAGIQAAMDAFITPRTLTAENLLSVTATLNVPSIGAFDYTGLTPRDKAAYSDYRISRSFYSYRLSDPSKANSLIAGTGGASDQIGAGIYGMRTSGVMACYPHCAFSVHPDGHWAVVSPVMHLYAGDVIYLNGVYDNPTIANVQQDFTDIISFNDPKSGVSKKTNHLTMFNKAYEKAVQKSDLFYLVTRVAGALRATNRYDANAFVNVAWDYVNIQSNVNLVPRDMCSVWFGATQAFEIRGSSMFFGE